MLSFETEDRLCRFLLFLSKSYDSTNKIKKKLNNLQFFSTFSIFNKLDFKNKNYLEPMDFVLYFQSHGIRCTSREAQDIILYYDYNFDNKLSYGEFLNLVLAKEIRSNYTKDELYIQPINSEISHLFLLLMQNELEFVKISKDLLAELRSRFDFSVDMVYKTLGGINNKITKENLRNFFIRNKRSFDEEDLDNLFKKMDIQKKEGFITYDEINRIFYFANQEVVTSNTKKYKEYIENIVNFNMNQYINNKNSINSYNKSNKDDKVLKKEIPFQTYLDKIKNQKEPTKPQIIKNEDNNNNYINIINNYTDKQKNKINVLKVPINNLFINLFEVIYNEETEIEKLKKALAVRKDFNIDDAYRLFKINEYNNEDLGENDVFHGLKSLEINPTSEEVQLFINRFSLKKDRKINYSDLFEMLVPFERKYRELVEKRTPSTFEMCCDRTDFFLGKTKNILGEIFEKIILYENKINLIRKRITNACLGLRYICLQIDKEKKGWITHYNIRDFIREYINPNASEKECDLIFIRLDKKRINKVFYEDVMDEAEVKDLN